MLQMDSYLSYTAGLPALIWENEREAILQAATLMADCYERGKLTHIFGTGAHSSIAGEEFFLRPGSLMNINPMFDPGLSVTHSAWRSWMIESLTGYARPIIDYYPIHDGDVFLVVNPYGLNCVTIDAANIAKEKGASVVALCSKEFGASVPTDFPSRHPSGKNLFELPSVDVVIDLHVCKGDTLIAADKFEQTMGPVSTICVSLALSFLNAATVDALVGRGISPDVIRSPYTMANATVHNQAMVDKYYDRIKHI